MLYMLIKGDSWICRGSLEFCVYLRVFTICTDVPVEFALTFLGFKCVTGLT